MTLLSKLSSLTLTGALLGASALAQTRFCLGGDLDQLSNAQKASCSAKLQTIRGVAAAMHAPENWHFVVVCGEQGWKDYAAYSMLQSDALDKAIVNTDLMQHETFFRESRLDAINAGALQKVIAHELAHIQLRTSDESAIEDQASRLMMGSDLRSAL